MSRVYAGRVSSISPASALVERIYSELKEDLVGCVIRPGDDLSEAELATRFGTSKTPVREALQRLRLEGLVDVAHRRGYRATLISVSDVKEVYGLRAILEPAATALAAQRASEAELEELATMCDAMSDADMAPQERRRWHVQFHISIVRIGGNGRLTDVVKSLHEESMRILSLFDTQAAMSLPTRDNHEDLLLALAAHDSGRAFEVAESRISLTRDAILSTLTDLGTSV